MLIILRRSTTARMPGARSSLVYSRPRFHPSLASPGTHSCAFMAPCFSTNPFVSHTYAKNTPGRSFYPPSPFPIWHLRDGRSAQTMEPESHPGASPMTTAPSPISQPTATDWRNEWHEFEGTTYLNLAGQSPIPKVAVRALLEAMDWKKSPHNIPDAAYFDTPNKIRAGIAKLING